MPSARSSRSSPALRPDPRQQPPRLPVQGAIRVSLTPAGTTWLRAYDEAMALGLGEAGAQQYAAVVAQQAAHARP